MSMTQFVAAALAATLPFGVGQSVAPRVASRFRRRADVVDPHSPSARKTTTKSAGLAERLVGVAGIFVLIAVQSSQARDEGAYATRIAADAEQLRTCLAANAAAIPKNCVGAIADTCAKRTSDTGQAAGCYRREAMAWQVLIEQYGTNLRRAAMNEPARLALIQSQVSWIDGRDKTCRFSADYFDGAMLHPWLDRCYAQEDGRRAIYLRHLAASTVDLKS